MKKFVLGMLLTAIVIPSMPAMAQQDRSWSEDQRDEDSRANQNQRRHHANGHDDDRRDHQARDDRRDDRRNWNRGRHLGHQKRAAWRDYNRYDYNRFEPRYGNYQANRYYRDGSYYQDRRLTNQDRIYRGSNGQYYCRRNDGTTGLIIGAVGGGLLGRVIAPNGSKTLGTILGGAGGALIGRSIGRNGVRCN
jgi:Ni/Co efflux regulator RcnB